MLQLKRKQKNQDHFGCRITCGYCGKQKHYEDESHIKGRESEQLKKAEEERRKNAGKGGKSEEGGPNPGRLKGKGNPCGGLSSSAPATCERGAPDPTPKGEQLG